MKLLEDIEKGILAGDWKQVVKAYNKLTGKDIKVPDLFDHKTANKRDVFNYLTNKMKITLRPIKEYTLEELRDLVDFYKNNTDNNKFDNIDNIEFEDKEIVEAIKKSTPDVNAGEFLFITNPDAVPEELKNMRPRLTDFPVYDDEKPIENKTYRAPVKFIKARCKKCNNMVERHPQFVVHSQGEDICVCEKCEDSR
jgi:hypothetical protein